MALIGYEQQRLEIRSAMTRTKDLAAYSVLAGKLREIEKLFWEYEMASLEAQEISQCLLWQAWLGIGQSEGGMTDLQKWNIHARL